MKKILTFFVLWTVCWTGYGLAREAGQPWPEVKGEHFIVYYYLDSDSHLAQDIVRKAEDYYQRIGDRTGYTRYSQFWTWDERVKIMLFPDQESFLKQTGSPQWSNGYSDRESRIFRSRAIVTYRQETGFLDGLLPHEIAHLVLHDYIPVENIPMWFDEGVAQLEEQGKLGLARDVVRAALSQGKLIPFAVLFNTDIRRERDPEKVGLFYAQSLVLVDFLASQYGQEDFRRLCRDLRDQRSFDEALPHAYSNQILSVDDLERKWKDYLSQ